MQVTEVCSNFSAVVRKTQKLLNQIRPTDSALRRILPSSNEEFSFSVSWRQGEEKANIKVMFFVFRKLMFLIDF